MSLSNAITKLQSLIPKDSGHLIRHQDWNDLIGALGEFGTALTAHAQDLNTLKTQVQQLETSVTAVVAQTQDIDNRLGALEQQVSPLLENYLLTLACARLVYASGETCELTAKVTNLTGRPLPAPFPWVDFVAAWGRLRAMPGFNSQPGGGDNSIAVQVNAQGIAQVQLRADHSQGFSDTEEAQIGAMMQMQVAEVNMNVAQAFLQAATPSDQRAKAAYQVLHQEYERKDSQAFRSYADTYHARTPEWKIQPSGSAFWTQWRDCRATVLAFARRDADPTTPDAARGTASIQVLFRDWLWPWRDDYLGDIRLLEEAVVTGFRPIFEHEDFYIRFRQKFDEAYVDRGILGRRKWVEAVQKGFDRIDPGPNPRLQEGKEQILKALAAQDVAEMHGAGRSPAVIEAHIGQNQRTQTVQQQVQLVGQQVEETKTVQAAVNVLEGRMQSAERTGSLIESRLTLINDNVRAINPLDENSLKASVQKISADIALLRARPG